MAWGKWNSQPRMIAANDPAATAVVMQLESLEAQAKRLEAAQLETNRLLAALLVQMGGRP
jgi:hypothetical protein